MGAALAAAALVVGAGGGYALGRTTGGEAAAEEDEHGHEPGSIEAIAEELAEDQARDRAALNLELVEAARTAHDQLSQVLRSMAPAVPLDPAAAPAPVDAAEVTSWATVAEQAEQVIAAVPEGHAAFNVTRAALLASAALLSDAVSDFSRAVEEPSAAPEAVTEAAARRDGAVDVWQAGAEQLDGLVVEAGQEHVHLFLDRSGDPDAVPLEFREPEEP